MKLFLVIGAFFSFVLFGLVAEEKTGYSIEQIEQMFPSHLKAYRINNLWPENLAMQLPIDPAIPEDFILKRLENTEFPDYFLWGSKETLDAVDPHNIQESLRSTNRSILVFRPSYDIAQTGPQSFSREKELEKEFKGMGLVDFFKKTYAWGSFPVLTVGGTRKGKFVFAAWIGLNYGSNVLFARLLYPPGEGRPNSEDIALWNRFLSETKPLPEPDCFIAQRVGMEPGYTVFEQYGAKLTCIAERRKEDSKVQVVVISRDKDTTFSVVKIEGGQAGTSWRYGEELIKIELRISKQMPEGGSIELLSYFMPVFPKTVDQFSLQKETLQLMKDVFVEERTFKPLV